VLIALESAAIELEGNIPEQYRKYDIC